MIRLRTFMFICTLLNGQYIFNIYAAHQPDHTSKICNIGTVPPHQQISQSESENLTTVPYREPIPNAESEGLFINQSHHYAAGKHKRDHDDNDVDNYDNYYSETDMPHPAKKTRRPNITPNDSPQDPPVPDILNFLADVLDADCALYHYATWYFIHPALKRIEDATKITFIDTSKQHSSPPIVCPINTQIPKKTNINLSADFAHTQASLVENHTIEPYRIFGTQIPIFYTQVSKKIKDNQILSLKLPHIITLIEKYAPHSIKPQTERRDDECPLCNAYRYRPHTANGQFQKTCIRKHILKQHADIINIVSCKHFPIF